MLAKENPFATTHLEKLPFLFLEGSWDSFLQQLAAMNFRGAIVGPQGSGKTTLIGELQNKLIAAGRNCTRITLRSSNSRYRRYQYSNLDKKLVRGLSHDSTLLLDGAEQLNFLEWRFIKLFSYRLRGIIITSHRPGLLPTLFQCRTTVDLLGHTISSLANNLHLSEEALAALYKRHQGNIRHSLLELYDQVAAR